MNFSCKICGNCCRGEPGYVWVTDEEISAIASVLGQEVREFKEQHVRKKSGYFCLKERANGDCVMLCPQTLRCTVYEVRPQQCRTFPFWDELMSSKNMWEKYAEKCPGMGAYSG